MANRINLGGFYPSQGEKSKGELRARYYVEYSNALSNKLLEIWNENQDEYDTPREVLADVIAGELDDEMQADNEVDPEDYVKEEWLQTEEEESEEQEAEAEADD